MSVIQLLLVIFSKRLDNLFSVYGGLDLQICIYRKYAFRFTAFSFLFIVLYCKYDSESYFFQYVIHLFFLVFFLSFPFAFRSKMLKTSNFYPRLWDFIYICQFCFIKNIYHQERNQPRFSSLKKNCYCKI